MHETDAGVASAVGSGLRVCKYQKPEARRLKPDPRQFEFLMVKLLRVYGECLGTKSR